jgi:hypothetical protein
LKQGPNQEQSFTYILESLGVVVKVVVPTREIVDQAFAESFALVTCKTPGYHAPDHRVEVVAACVRIVLEQASTFQVGDRPCERLLGPTTVSVDGSVQAKDLVRREVGIDGHEKGIVHWLSEKGERAKQLAARVRKGSEGRMKNVVTLLDEAERREVEVAALIWVRRPRVEVPSIGEVVDHEATDHADDERVAVAVLLEVSLHLTGFPPDATRPEERLSVGRS